MALRPQHLIVQFVGPELRHALLAEALPGMEDLVADPYPTATCPDSPVGGRGKGGNSGVVGGHCPVGGHHVDVPVPSGHFLTGGRSACAL